MHILDKILRENIRLIDYEYMVNDDNNSIVNSGKSAGIVGAVDFLKGFGEYLLQMGISTPFLHCSCTYKYFNVADCYNHLKLIG